MLIVIVVAVIFYMKIMKNKDKNKTNTVTQVYNPVQKDEPLNPAVSDFLVTNNTSQEENNKKE